MPQKTIQYSKQVRIIRNVSSEAKSIICEIIREIWKSYIKDDLVKMKKHINFLESTLPAISEDIVMDIFNNIHKKVEPLGISIKYGTVKEVIDQIDEYCKNISSVYGISSMKKISICREQGMELLMIVYRAITEAIGKHSVLVDQKTIRMGFYRPGEEE